MKEQERLDFYGQYKQFNEKQGSIKSYIAERATQRPKTNAFHIGVTLLFYCLSCGIASCVTCCLCERDLYKTIIVVLIWILPFLIFARGFLIKLIECYQHYAKISTRTKCLCKPTCSEYSIAVLKKYSLPVALFKIRKRLFKTCRGGIYKIDLP